MGVAKEVKYHYTCDFTGCNHSQSSYYREDFEKAGWLAVHVSSVSRPPGVSNAPLRRGVLCPEHANQVSRVLPVYKKESGETDQ